MEIVGGVALLTVSPAFILRALTLLTQDELAKNPRDLVANYAIDIVNGLSVGTQHFVALYLLGHGIVKILVVGALLGNKVWAYPIAAIVFGAFIAYQIYRFTLTHSAGLIALSVFDASVVLLIWLEYRALTRRT